jgi:hypothetical protein
MEVLWFAGGAIACVMLMVMVAIWATSWTQIRRAEIDTQFKQDMLARGLSVEDIERLLKASSDPAPGRVPPQPLAKEPFSLAAYRVVGAIENMVESGRDTPEIVALLEIFLQQGGESSETGREPAQPLEPAAAAARRADSQRLCSGLAPALESMVQAGRTREEIAGFLDTFLQRSGEPPESGKAPDQPFPPIGAAVRSSDIQRLGSGRDG